MNIDQRLDRLTERHEALTQTVELLAHEIAELKSVTAELQTVTVANAEAIAILVRLVTSHENRIDRLEQK